MAEFLTMEEAEDKFGKKGTARAGLTLGIIGTALAALGNNNGCGCGGNGILGGLFGGNNNGCAMQAAEQAKTLAMAQGQMADNLSWANRVQSLQDDVDLYTYINATQEGKTAANNLLNSIKRIKDKVSEDLKAKQKKVDELIHLLENDPELKKRYEELSIGK
jgi:hypothetical protein